MSEFWEIMLAPFLACLILSGMHAYLGFHVIKREVVFVDLALAQLAAFGATFGFLWNFKLHTTESYLLSLGFTLAGAAIFAATRLRKPKVPQEALIGIVYAVAAAASILVLSGSPEGGEELKALLTGHLLFVDWHEIRTLIFLYGLIAIIHFIFRKQFLLISISPEKAFQSGMKVRLWDFLFYGTFGLVVTSSTELAGVLLVFSFLIVPAVCGAILSDSLVSSLIIGWGCGLFTSILGISASYFLDLPTGAAVVCAFGLTLILCSLYRLIIRKEETAF